MFIINHNLDVQVFPPPRPRNLGWLDSFTSAIGAEVDHAKDTITSAIQEGINRGEAALSSILVPDFIHAPETNSVGSIVADSNGCAPFSGGKATNFVMLDFVDVGEGLKAVDYLNGLLS